MNKKEKSAFGPLFLAEQHILWRETCLQFRRKMRKISFYVESFSSSIMIAVLCPVAVVGNALIVAAIWKKTFKRTPFHLLLSALAITDFCTGAIAQPLIVAATLLQIASDCKSYSYCRNMPMITKVIDTVGYASATYFFSITALFTALMAVERWLHMTRRSKLTSRRRYIVVIAILMLPLPAAIFRSLESMEGRLARKSNITIIALGMVCFLTTFVAYFQVLRIIRRHRQRVQRSMRTGNFGPSAINLAKYEKSVMTILYIVGLFYFCFFPYIVTIGLFVRFGNNDSRELSVALHITAVFLFASSSLNPLLYLWRMNDVRTAVKRLFFRGHE